MTAADPIEAAAERPHCDHHFVSHHGGSLPPAVAWVSVCSYCGDITVELRAGLLVSPAQQAVLDAADEWLTSGSPTKLDRAVRVLREEQNRGPVPAVHPRGHDHLDGQLYCNVPGCPDLESYFP